MPAVTPRWEWRTFAESLGDAERRFGELTPGPVQESDELYLLSPNCDGSVKVRDGLMDIKALEQVDESGLEQWRPVAKSAFPLAPADVARVCAALAVAPLPLREPISLERLRAELAHPSRGVRAVALHKRRRRYTIDGCAAELTDVTADDRATRTVAIESEDPARVRAAVRKLGLAGFENVSYPRGLKRLLGLPAGAARKALYAVIDVGTNSVKFHIGEKRADGSWSRVVDRSEVTRLGESLSASGGSFTADAIERTAAAIAEMAAEARRHGVLGVAAVGTMGVRTARNGGELIAEVERRCGVRIEVVPGTEEARLACLAVSSSLGLGGGSLLIFDTGGGSSQFTFSRGAAVEEQFSVNVGAVRFAEKYGLSGVTPPAELQRALTAITAELSRLDALPTPETLVGMGGAVTNLTAVMLALGDYDPDAVQASTLTLSEVDRQIDVYASRSADERRRIVGLQPKRAEVILAGACIVRTILARLRKDALKVSDRGLRHGLLVDRFGGKQASSVLRPS